MRAGAILIANLSASGETMGKAEYRRQLMCGQSARLFCGDLYADAGQSEFSTDMVFAIQDHRPQMGQITKNRQKTGALPASSCGGKRLFFHCLNTPDVSIRLT